MKRTLYLFAAMVCACACACVARGAGTGSVSVAVVDLGRIDVYTYTWACPTNSADVSGTPNLWVRGEIARVVFPATSSPSNNYDVTIHDEQDVDLLGGQGSNIATASVVNVCGGVECSDGGATNMIPFAVNNRLTINVQNATSSGTGTIILYIK